MPLPTSPLRTHRHKVQRLREERILRAGEEMRGAHLAEIPVQPARRRTPPEPHVVIDLRDDAGPLHRAEVEPADPEHATPEHAAPELTEPETYSQPDPPVSPISFRWDTTRQLLQRLPRLVPDGQADGAGWRGASDRWDDAIELLRRLPRPDPDDGGEDAAPLDGLQGEFPIVLEVPALMSDPGPFATA